MIVTAIRHAESLGNAGLAEGPDPALSPLGEEQARLAGERLAADGVTHVWSSPYRRAIMTAAEVARHPGLDVILRPDMCEHHHYENLEDFRFRPATEVIAEFPAARASDRFGDELPVPEWPESWEDLLARTHRVAEAALELGESDPDVHLVIVGHGASVKGLVTALGGEAIDQYAGFVNAAVSRVRLAAGLPGEVLFLNDASHLAPLQKEDE